MRTVHVKTSREYDVFIGSGLLQSVGSYAAACKHTQTVCIVSDSNVFPLYGKTVAGSLAQQGYTVTSFVFPAGESSKNGETYLQLLNFLAENRISRSDLIVALGGGVVGDLAGFAAATYLRGISYIQIPTTLLAAVDSSVGGKTAIDLPAGKNLAGAFCQPSLVICDIDSLNTLPPEVFRDGCAEVIKYGILYDSNLFAHLLDRGLDFDRESVITRCIELKRDVVAEDEFDTGARMKLNLGHTVGHAIESASNYLISHGLGVAAGMAIAARSSYTRGICKEDDMNQIIAVLEKFSLPTDTPYPSEVLAGFAVSDKKRAGTSVRMILPERIGFCRIETVPVSDIQAFIEAGL